MNVASMTVMAMISGLTAGFQGASSPARLLGASVTGYRTFTEGATLVPGPSLYRSTGSSKTIFTGTRWTTLM